MYKVGDFYDIDGIGVAVITCVDDPVIMVRRGQRHYKVCSWEMGTCMH